MNSVQKTLLTFGFVREYCKSQNIELFPDDIISLFVSWLFFYDHFDAEKSHPYLNIEIIDHQYELLSVKVCKQNHRYPQAQWCTAVGTLIIEKGEKYAWKFRMYTPALHFANIQLGIIDDDMFKTNEGEYIDDLSSGKWNGWGLFLYEMDKYHGSPNDDGTVYYAHQFNYKKGDIITIILDMTQENNEKYGVLSCEIDAEIDEETMKYFAKNDRLSPVIYDNVDINKRYRMAVGIQRNFTEPISLCLMNVTSL